MAKNATVTSKENTVLKKLLALVMEQKHFAIEDVPNMVVNMAAHVGVKPNALAKILKPIFMAALEKQFKPEALKKKNLRRGH